MLLVNKIIFQIAICWQFAAKMGSLLTSTFQLYYLMNEKNVK